MTSNKRTHVEDAEEMQDSGEEVSGDEESDEEVKILPGEEVT